MLQWYLFRVRAKSERKVSRQVEAMGFSSFLPQVLKANDDRRSVPLFPGYLFIRLDPHQSSFSSILRLFGMIDVVRTSGELKPVELALVVSLRRRCQAQPRLALQLPQPGSRVVFSHGAFNEVEGLFQEISDEQRCRLLVQLVNRQHQLDVPLSALRL